MGEFAPCSALIICVVVGWLVSLISSEIIKDKDKQTFKRF